MKIEHSDLIYLPHQLHIFSFGRAYFFENVIISEFDEGSMMNFKNLSHLISEATKYYGFTKNLVYLSNRVHSYSVDHLDWKISSKGFKNLKGIGVISYNSFNRKVVDVEKIFCAKQMMSFPSLNDAIDWACELLEIRNCPLAVH